MAFGVVTGGDTGIGLAVTRLLAAQGHHVGVGSRRPDRAAQVVEDLVGQGLEASVLSLDVTDGESIDRALTPHARVDFLVNAAAIHSYRPLDQLTEDEFQATVDVNLTGTFRMCRRTMSRMPAGGSMVNFSSRNVAGGRGIAHYAASKAGINGLTAALATELRDRGIRVNAVVPGLVDTPMSQRIFEERGGPGSSPETERQVLSPEDVSPVVAFLVSEASASITGQTIVVDGGRGLPT